MLDREVPNLEADLDWDVEGPKLRDRLVNFLDERILPGLAETITEDFFVTPRTFESRFLSHKGLGVLDPAGLHPVRLVPLPQRLGGHRRPRSWERVRTPGPGCPASSAPRRRWTASPAPRSERRRRRPGERLRAMSVEAPSVAGAEALRQHGRTFHAAHLLLGRRAAEGVHLLYGFCRHVDDLADELPLDESRVALAGVRRELSGEIPPSPVAGFRRFLETHPVEPGAAEEFLRGVEQDLDVTRYETEEQLIRYCFRVAGTVGLFMCGLFEVRDRRALPFAIDLGIGMQLTNICRDVLEDAGRGRVYLPASLTDGAVDPAELVAGRPGACPRRDARSRSSCAARASTTGARTRALVSCPPAPSWPSRRRRGPTRPSARACWPRRRGRCRAACARERRRESTPHDPRHRLGHRPRARAVLFARSRARQQAPRRPRRAPKVAG